MNVGSPVVPGVGTIEWLELMGDSSSVQVLMQGDIGLKKEVAGATIEAQRWQSRGDGESMVEVPGRIRRHGRRRIRLCNRFQLGQPCHGAVR